MPFGHGFDLFLLLVRIIAIKTGTLLLLVVTDISTEDFAFLIHHISQIQGASFRKGFLLFLGQLILAEGCRHTVRRIRLRLLRELSAFFEGKVVVEDKLDASFLGIDLKRGIERFAATREHTFYFHGLTFGQVPMLLFGQQDAFNLLRNDHAVGTKGDQLIGQRVD